MSRPMLTPQPPGPAGGGLPSAGRQVVRRGQDPMHQVGRRHRRLPPGADGVTQHLIASRDRATGRAVGGVGQQAGSVFVAIAAVPRRRGVPRRAGRPEAGVRIEQLVPLTLEVVTGHDVSFSDPARSGDVPTAIQQWTPRRLRSSASWARARWSQVLTVPTGRETAVGDLLVGQILLVEQGEDQAIFGSEGLEPALQLAGQVVGVGQAGPRVGPILDRLRGPRAADGPGGPAPSGSDWRRSPAARGGAAGSRRTPRSTAGRGGTPPGPRPRRPGGGSSCGNTGRRRPPGSVRSAGAAPADRRHRKRLDQRGVVHRHLALPNGRPPGHRRQPGLPRSYPAPTPAGFNHAPGRCRGVPARMGRLERTPPDG